MKKSPCLVFAGVAALLTLVPAAAHAEDSSPDATTAVRVSSDWPNTELIRHLGTSYGQGVVNGRAASITTLHLEKLCRTPCTATLATEGSYYVDAPGMAPRNFQLPTGTKAVDVRVKGASSTPLVLSMWATLLGGSTAIVGGTLWAVLQHTDTTPFQTMTLVGGSVMLAGIAGLILLPRTHVETKEGDVLDAKAEAPKGVQFTGNGLVF